MFALILHIILLPLVVIVVVIDAPGNAEKQPTTKVLPSITHPEPPPEQEKLETVPTPTETENDKPSRELPEITPEEFDTLEANDDVTGNDPVNEVDPTIAFNIQDPNWKKWRQSFGKQLVEVYYRFLPPYKLVAEHKSTTSDDDKGLIQID